MTRSTSERPLIFYFFMIFLTCGWGFIGYNFAQTKGALICIFVALAVNFYALGIKEEE